ncbi:MAG: hypothetical protein ACI4L9_01280 [Candidatus Coproplasma sp.]
MKLIKRKTFKGYKSVIKSIELIGNGEEYADYGFNLVRDNGGYKRSIGAVRETFFGSCTREPRSVYYSSATGGLFMASASALFLFNVRTTQKFTTATTKLTLTPFFCDMYVDGKCVTVSFSGINRLVYDGVSITESTDTREFYTGVMHGGRFFARDYEDTRKIIWAASHAFDWTEGVNGCGYMMLPPEGGDVLKLVSFGDKLLAIRRCGITVIRACCEPQHFKVEPSATYLTADGIVAETCAVCAGKLFFATESGVYAFDGSDISCVENSDAGRISAPVQAVASGDKYFMICTDEYLGSNNVFGYDAVKKSGWFMGVSPSKLFTIEEYAFLVYGTGVYRFCAAKSSRGYWRSKEMDFGTPSVKYLRRLYIDGDEDVNIMIDCDGITRELMGNGWLTLNMYGKSFAFIFGTFNRLSRAVVEVEVKNGI